MVTIVALVLTVTVIAFVLYWSGRHGDPNRGSGTSLRRKVRAHTTSNGKPKFPYASRIDAEAGARTLTKRGGVPMSAYRCDTCSKWHVGH